MLDLAVGKSWNEIEFELHASRLTMHPGNSSSLSEVTRRDALQASTKPDRRVTFDKAV
jgi:hypothetical protein